MTSDPTRRNHAPMDPRLRRALWRSPSSAGGQPVKMYANDLVQTIGDGGYALHIGGPGDYANGVQFSVPFTGDLAALRIYDSQLSASERAQIASTLFAP